MNNCTKIYILVPSSFNTNLWNEDINENFIQRRETEEKRKINIFLRYLQQTYNIKVPALNYTKKKKKRFF